MKDTSEHCEDWFEFAYMVTLIINKNSSLSLCITILPSWMPESWNDVGDYDDDDPDEFFFSSYSSREMMESVSIKFRHQERKKEEKKII